MATGHPVLHNGTVEPFPLLLPVSPMYQVKIFKSVESELTNFQNEINTWLRTSNAKVVQITGNISPQTVLPDQKSGGFHAFTHSDIFVIILYQD